MSEATIYVEADDGPEVYLPVEHFTIAGARHEASRHAADTIGGWGRARYVGRRDVRLCDHEGWEECETCPKVSAWTFETYEGTYRR